MRHLPGQGDVWLAREEARLESEDEGFDIPKRDRAYAFDSLERAAYWRTQIAYGFFDRDACKRHHRRNIIAARSIRRNPEAIA